MYDVSCFTMGAVAKILSILENCRKKIIVPSTCRMPPKRKPVTKVVSKPRKLSETDSPSPAIRSDEEKPMTPLLERIRRKSGDGKPLDMNMSATSSVEHGESPAWKKSKNTDVVAEEGDQSQASNAVNVCVNVIFPL